MANKSNAAAAFKRNLAALNLDEEPGEEPVHTPPVSVSLSNYVVKQIPFDLLEPNRFQSQLRPEGLAEKPLRELAENMAVNGFTSVILVRPYSGKPGYYEVGHGHRRLAALKIAADLDVPDNKVKDLKKIPARIAENVTDSEWLDIAVSENLSREDLTPLAIAKSFEAIRSLHPGISLANIAQRVGRSKSWVQRYDSINGAPEHLITMISKKPDSLEHLFIISRKVTDPGRQKELARQVLEEKLTLGELQQLVGDKKPANSSPNKPPTPSLRDITLPTTSRVAQLINRLETNIGYLHQQVEQDNYYLTFEEHDKLEQLTSQLNELLTLTRAVVRT